MAMTTQLFPARSISPPVCLSVVSGNRSESLVELLQGPFPTDGITKEDGEKVNGLVVPKTSSHNTYLFTDLSQEAVLAQIFDDEHDFSEPGGGRGLRPRHSLDADLRISHSNDRPPSLTRRFGSMPHALSSPLMVRVALISLHLLCCRDLGQPVMVAGFLLGGRASPNALGKRVERSCERCWFFERKEVGVVHPLERICRVQAREFFTASPPQRIVALSTRSLFPSRFRCQDQFDRTIKLVAGRTELFALRLQLNGQGCTLGRCESIHHANQSQEERPKLHCGRIEAALDILRISHKIDRDSTVNEKQPCHSSWMSCRIPDSRVGPQAPANHKRSIASNLVHDDLGIAQEAFERDIRRACCFAMIAKIEGDKPIRFTEFVDESLPTHLCCSPSVKEQKRLSLSCLADRELDPSV